MDLRRALSALLIVLAVSPAWGAAEPLGSITSTSKATVRNTKLTPGATVFSGDAISVAEHGTTQIALNGGTKAEILGNSAVRLTKTNGKIQMIVDRGQASFRTSGNNGMNALVGDVNVRPVDGAETSAVIHSLSGTHAVIAVQKSALLVTTAFDGKTYTVNEGQAADLSAASDPPQGGGAAPAGKAAPAGPIVSKKVVIWTVVIVGSGAALAAYFLARKENTPSTTILQNEISPAKLP